MKLPFLPALTLVAALLLTAGCQTVDRRIQEKSAVFAALPPDVQARIKQGIVDVGYTPDLVYLALGEPSEKRERRTAEDVTEIWLYNIYYDTYEGLAPVGLHRHVFFDPVLGHYRAYGVPNYGALYSVEKEERVRILFKDGKVTVIEQAKD